MPLFLQERERARCYAGEGGRKSGELFAAARPEVSGKNEFSPRNDGPYGLKYEALQRGNAPERSERLEGGGFFNNILQHKIFQ